MRGEGGLDLERRHPDARHLEHVIGTPAALVITVGIADVFVSRIGPRAHEGALALGALVPVALGGRRPADHKFADLPFAEFAAVLVEDARRVARHRLAGRAVAQVARPIAEKDMQHLGRPDAIEDLDSDDVAPALADVGRQRLAGRHA